jgi:hypothetical protein
MSRRGQGVRHGAPPGFGVTSAVRKLQNPREPITCTSAPVAAASSVTDLPVLFATQTCVPSDEMAVGRDPRLDRCERCWERLENGQRPHRGIGLGVPAGSAGPSVRNLEVRRHDVLGGLIHEYHPVAA